VQRVQPSYRLLKQTNKQTNKLGLKERLSTALDADTLLLLAHTSPFFLAHTNPFFWCREAPSFGTIAHSIVLLFQKKVLLCTKMVFATFTQGAQVAEVAKCII
jgi:hypothetical protein